MKFRSLVVALLLAALWPASLLRADEPILEFLAGLRAREYYDTALQYLDLLEQRGDLSAEVRQALPYERAITLYADARDQRIPEVRAKQFETARSLLAQFLKTTPKHPKAAEANSDLGDLYMTQGRLLSQQAKSLPGQAERAAMQTQARGEFEKARLAFEAALRLHKAKYDAFPKQIDKVTQKAEFAAREQALSTFIKAQFDLGHCTFEEAHAHDASSPEAKALLARAAGEFDKIYQQFRTNGAGIYALLFQGQCFQEQGELSKALGIFDQILKLQEETGRLRPLQDQARHLRLVCLGDEKRPDLKGVKAEAEEWLKTASPASKRSQSGLGIQWEFVQALDKLAKDKETTSVEKDLYLKQALATAQFIHQFPGELKAPSTQIIGRLSSALKIKKTGAPRDFDSAYAAAMQMGEELDKRMRGLETGTAEEKAMQEEAFKLHLREMANALRVTMTLFTRKDSTIDLNNARLQLAKIYFSMKDHSYDAALLAEHIARHYKSVDEKVAQEAAELAMAAYYQGYHAAPEAQQKSDLEQLKSLADQIVAQWPNTDLSNKALMNLGQLYLQKHEPAKAAEFYNKVPPEATSYLDAQLARGLAYWHQYATESVILPIEKRPKKEVLDKLRDQAEQILDQSVKKAEAKLTKGQSAAYPVNSAKLSLVQILNSSGSYDKAIALLTAGDRPLVKEVAVADPKTRPEHGGTTSREFAFLTFNELLRSYVGVHDVEKAQGALKQLETLESGNPQGLTALLQNLGKALQGEVQRLQQAKDPRVSEVTASFEKFLAELLQRKEAQEVSMLLWIGETYAALGNGVKEGGGNQEKSKELFGKAIEANKGVLKLIASDPKVIDPKHIPTIQLRLISNLRNQQSFELAVEEVRKLIKENKNNFDAQIEVARIYTDWGLHSDKNSSDKWMIAVKGDRATNVWGWEAITNRLLGAYKAKGTPELKKVFLDARYNVILGFFNYGLQQAKPDSKLKFLQRGRLEIMATGILNSLDKNDPDWKRFDTLFRDIQTQSNTIAGTKDPVVGIDVALKPEVAKPEAADSEPEAGKKGAEGGGDEDVVEKKEKQPAAEVSEKATKAKPAKKEEKTGTSPMMIVFLVLIGVGACGFVGYMVWSSAKKTRRPNRRRAKAAEESEDPTATKKTATRKRRPLPATPPEETE